MAEWRCSACGFQATGRYCSRCGAPGAASASPGTGKLAYWLAGGFVLLAALVILLPSRKSGTSSSPAAAPVEASAEEAPPDLSTMTPRERFDRLYNRVMRAAEQGDSATVSRFSPMAFQAYGMLDSTDADARYHVAVLHLHVQGDTAAALRLADSIQADTPHHLFIYLIRGTAAGLAGNERLLARARADFLAAWDAEMKLGRPEYRDHQTMLDQFRETARQAPSSSRTPSP